MHTGLLEELDTELDTTHSRLSGARRRLDRVAKGARENGACIPTGFVKAAVVDTTIGSTVTIGLLILVLLILIIVFKT